MTATEYVIYGLTALAIAWNVFAYYRWGPAATITEVLSNRLATSKWHAIPFYGWAFYITLMTIRRVVSLALFRAPM